MKRGQTALVVIFVVLVVILAFSFYAYYSGVPGTTGNVVKENVTVVERGSLTDHLIVPESLDVLASIGSETTKNFEVANYNDRAVSVSCSFPPFQDFVPSSNCFTYDSSGKFVGSDSVSISPGDKHVFVASVKPFTDVRIKKGDVETVVNIRAGEYSGEVELQAWFTQDEKKAVSVITIPVKITVEE